jgi:hypothetical protein
MHVLSKVHQHILRPRYPVSPEEAEVLSRRAVKRSQKVASLPPDTHPEKRARHDYHAAGAHAEAKNAHMMLGNMEGARRHYKQEVAHENAYNTTPFSSDEEIPES